ncbi:hypothetical protein OMR07_05075, partial [Methylobacterium organophilum]|nr:hypothetical protein [Methylobacterium organophilum]
EPSMNQHFSTHAASPSLRSTRLPNGVTVVTEPMPGVATASLGAHGAERGERADEARSEDRSEA